MTKRQPIQLTKCPNCNKLFNTKHGLQKYCSKNCRALYWFKANNLDMTEETYRSLNGNFERHLKRCFHNIKCKRKQDKIKDLDFDVSYLIELLNKQNGLCALSGIPLTCKMEKGKHCLTNISVDRIDNSKGYTKSNIRLVTFMMNLMKWKQTDEEFINNCKLVLERNKNGKIRF